MHHIELTPQAIEAAAQTSTTGRSQEPGYRRRVEELLRAAVPYMKIVDEDDTKEFPWPQVPHTDKVESLGPLRRANEFPHGGPGLDIPRGRRAV